MTLEPRRLYVLIHNKTTRQDDYRDTSLSQSLFILWITVPRSSVRPSLTRAWWLSATGYVAAIEPPPGRGGRQWLGSLPGIAPGLASQKATARSPGRQPFWPTQSHLLHPMALQWPERAERALSTPNPNPILVYL